MFTHIFPGYDGFQLFACPVNQENLAAFFLCKGFAVPKICYFGIAQGNYLFAGFIDIADISVRILHLCETILERIGISVFRLDDPASFFINIAITGFCALPSFFLRKIYAYCRQALREGISSIKGERNDFLALCVDIAALSFLIIHCPCQTLRKAAYIMVIIITVCKLRIAFHIENHICSVPSIQTQEAIAKAAQSENILIAILEQYLTLLIQEEPICLLIFIFLRRTQNIPRGIDIFFRNEIIAADRFDIIIAVCQGDAEHCRFACSLDGRSIVFRCRSQLCQLYGCGFCFCIPAKSIRIDDIAAIALQHALPIAQGDKNSAVLDLHLPKRRQQAAVSPDAVAGDIKAQRVILHGDLGKLNPILPDKLCIRIQRLHEGTQREHNIAILDINRHIQGLCCAILGKFRCADPCRKGMRCFREQ